MENGKWKMENCAAISEANRRSWAGKRKGLADFGRGTKCKRTPTLLLKSDASGVGKFLSGVGGKGFQFFAFIPVGFCNRFVLKVECCDLEADNLLGQVFPVDRGIDVVQSGG